MRTKPLTIILDFDYGAVVPDNSVMSFVEKTINSEEETVTIGSDLLVHGFRTAVVRGLIDPSCLFLEDKENIYQINPNTYFFGDSSFLSNVETNLLFEILQARIKNTPKIYNEDFKHA